MRRRRRRDIVIELTALLDVIMIMIFMVMKENGQVVVETQDALAVVQQENAEQAREIDRLTEELAEAQAMLREGDLADVLARLKDAESRLEAYRAIEDEVIVLNIELRNNVSHSVRYLTYGKSGDTGSSVKRASRTDDDFYRAVNNLKVFVSDYADTVCKDKTNSIIVCVIFLYDPSEVFQRDFALVDAALREAEAQAGNQNFRYRAILRSKK